MVEKLYSIRGANFSDDNIKKCQLNYIHQTEKKYNVFCIEAAGYDNTPFDYNLDVIVNLVKKFGTEYNLIDFVSTEHYVTNDNIEKLTNRLPGINILILSSNLAGNKFKNHMFYSKFLFELLDLYSIYGSIIEKTFTNILNDKKRLKKILFLNNRFRNDRIRALEWLYNKNLLNDIQYSFNETIEIAIDGGDKEDIKEFNIIKHLPIYLDTLGDKKKKINGYMNVSLPQNFNYTFYYNAYIELIFETYNQKLHGIEQSSDTIIHLTEKLFKPLVFGFPFYAYGCKDLKVELQKKLNLNFDTFLYGFNDSYDLNSFMLKIENILDLPYEDIHEEWYNIFGTLKQNRDSLKLYNMKIKRKIDSLGD